MARCLFFICLLISFRSAFSQDVDPDTINQIVTVEAKDARFYQQQAKRADDPSQALELYRKALALHNPSVNENWVADVRVQMATEFFKTGNSKQGFSELLTAEKIYTATGNNASKANVLVQMARFYEKNAAWTEAVLYYQEAQKIFESIESLAEAASTALHLTDISLIQNDITKAQSHASYAVKQYELLNSKTGLGLSYVRLAEIYRRRRQYSKAEKLILRSALPFFSSTGYKAGRIDAFDVLGKIYHSQKRNSEAKWFFIQANTQARALNDIEGTITSLINLSKVKIDIGDFSLAKRDLKEAQSLAKRRGNLFLLSNVKEAYATLYKKIGNQSGSESAAEYSAELKDSLNNYFDAQAESARTARVRSLPKREVTKPSVVSLQKKDDFLAVKMVVVALVILAIILLILRRIK